MAAIAVLWKLLPPPQAVQKYKLVGNERKGLRTNFPGATNQIIYQNNIIIKVFNYTSDIL